MSRLVKEVKQVVLNATLNNVNFKSITGKSKTEIKENVVYFVSSISNFKSVNFYVSVNENQDENFKNFNLYKNNSTTTNISFMLVNKTKKDITILITFEFEVSYETFDEEIEKISEILTSNGLSVITRKTFNKKLNTIVIDDVSYTVVKNHDVALNTMTLNTCYITNDNCVVLMDLNGDTTEYFKKEQPAKYNIGYVIADNCLENDDDVLTQPENTNELIIVKKPQIENEIIEIKYFDCVGDYKFFDDGFGNVFVYTPSTIESDMKWIILENTSILAAIEQYRIDLGYVKKYCLPNNEFIVNGELYKSEDDLIERFADVDFAGFYAVYTKVLDNINATNLIDFLDWENNFYECDNDDICFMNLDGVITTFENIGSVILYLKEQIKQNDFESVIKANESEFNDNELKKELTIVTKTNEFILFGDVNYNVMEIKDNQIVLQNDNGERYYIDLTAYLEREIEITDTIDENC